MERDFQKLAEELTVFLKSAPMIDKIVVKPTKKHNMVEGQVVETDEYDGMEVEPVVSSKNPYSYTLCCMEEIVDFARFHKLNHFVSIGEKWNTETSSIDKYLFCRLY